MQSEPRLLPSNTLFELLRRVAFGEHGAASIEYAIMASLLALGIVVSTGALGGQVASVLDEVLIAFQPAPPPSAGPPR